MRTHLTATTELTLAHEQIASYHASGFLIVRGVFSPEEVDELPAEAARLVQRIDLIDSDNIRCRWQNCVATGECRFDCLDPVIDISPVCAHVARDPRLIELVSARRAYLFIWQDQHVLPVNSVA